MVLTHTSYTVDALSEKPDVVAAEKFSKGANSKDHLQYRIDPLKRQYYDKETKDIAEISGSRRSGPARGTTNILVKGRDRTTHARSSQFNSRRTEDEACH